MEENNVVDADVTEQKFEVDEKKAEEALVYIREVCRQFNKCDDCVFGCTGRDKGTCMLMKGIMPDKWQLMCDGVRGKVFR